VLTIPAILAGWLVSQRESRSEINPENAKNLQHGMTLAHVEKILGGPARDESKPSDAVGTEDPRVSLAVWAWIRDLVRSQNGLHETHIWASSLVVVVVHLNDQGRLDSSFAVPVYPFPRDPNESVLKVLFDWLGLG